MIDVVNSNSVLIEFAAHTDPADIEKHFERSEYWHRTRKGVVESWVVVITQGEVTVWPDPERCPNISVLYVRHSSDFEEWSYYAYECYRVPRNREEYKNGVWQIMN